jgi:hypothetical protein
LPTARNTGPLLISAAASHVCLDRAQAIAARDRHLLPLPFLVGLAVPDQHPQPVRHLHQIIDLERAKLGAAERAGEAESNERPVALADHRVRAEVEHAGDDVVRGRRLALRRGADGAADTAQRRLHAPGCRGQRVDAGELVVVGDARRAPSDGARLPPRAGKVGQICRHDAGMRWQRRGSPCVAPHREVAGKSAA